MIFKEVISSHWISSTNKSFRYLLTKYKFIIKVNINEKVVALAAPINPNLGINKRFNVVFSIAQRPLSLNDKFTFPMLANIVLTDIHGEYSRYPTDNISMGMYAGVNSSENNMIMIYFPNMAKNINNINSITNSFNIVFLNSFLIFEYSFFP